MKAKKPNKDYQKIISQLENLYAHVSDMAKGDDADNIWKEDMEALQKAIDIISNYERATKQTADILQRYEFAEPVIQRDTDIYVCPRCGKRAGENHSHCHWCGKKLKWDKSTRIGDERLRKRDRQNG